MRTKFIDGCWGGVLDMIPYFFLPRIYLLGFLRALGLDKEREKEKEKEKGKGKRKRKKKRKRKGERRKEQKKAD